MSDVGGVGMGAELDESEERLKKSDKKEECMPLLGSRVKPAQGISS